jgi:hypothetical protein
MTGESVCGRPPGCKRLFVWTQGMWSGAVVCPASSCGNSHAAGPYGDTRTGSKSAWRARGAAIHDGFPDPVSLTVCPYPFDRPAHILGDPAQPIMRRPCRELGRPRPSHKGPVDPGGAVGQGDRDDQAGFLGQHAGEPWALRRSFARCPSHHDHRSADQQPTKVALPHLRGTSEPGLPSGSVGAAARRATMSARRAARLAPECPPGFIAPAMDQGRDDNGTSGHRRRSLPAGSRTRVLTRCHSRAG